MEIYIRYVYNVNNDSEEPILLVSHLTVIENVSLLMFL